MPDRVLLGVFAHPDDESFGPGATLAKYAREGATVHVCIATDGAAGSYDAAAVAGGQLSLAEQRLEELRCACQTLGVTLHLLGYRDSGMEGAPDNQDPASLYQAPLEEVARAIARLIRELRPQVVLTHDPTGGYFHPDHIKINRATQLAFTLAGDPAYLDGGGAPWQPARLYYTVIPRSALKWVLAVMRLRGQDPRRAGRNGDIDLTHVGVPNDQLHVRLNVGPYVAVKEQASACHRSQGGGGLQRRLPAFLRRYTQRYDMFMQAYPPAARPHRDLFAGLQEVWSTE